MFIGEVIRFLIGSGYDRGDGRGGGESLWLNRVSGYNQLITESLIYITVKLYVLLHLIFFILYLA